MNFIRSNRSSRAQSIESIPESIEQETYDEVTGRNINPEQLLIFLLSVFSQISFPIPYTHNFNVFSTTMKTPTLVLSLKFSNFQKVPKSLNTCTFFKIFKFSKSS